MQQLLDELEQNSRASSRLPFPFQPGAGAPAGGAVVCGSAGEDGAPIMLCGKPAIGSDHEERQWRSASAPEVEILFAALILPHFSFGFVSGIAAQRILLHTREPQVQHFASAWCPPPWRLHTAHGSKRRAPRLRIGTQPAHGRSRERSRPEQ